MKSRRMGKFYIVRSAFFEKDSDILEEIFVQLRFVPYRMEYQLDRDVNVYIGTSPKFELINTTEMAPEYDIIIEVVPESGEVKVSCEKDNGVKEPLSEDWINLLKQESREA